MITSDEQLITLFTSLGLSKPKAAETLKNANLSKRLENIANEAIKSGYSLSENGKLFYHLSSKMKSQHERFLSLFIRLIGEKQLDSANKITACLEFFLSNVNENIDLKALEEYCGIGKQYSLDEIKQVIEEIVQKHKNELISDKRCKSVIMHEVQEKLKWADGKTVAAEVNNALSKFSEKLDYSESLSSNQTNALKPEKSSKAERKETQIKQELVTESGPTILEVMKKLNFHKPGENYKTDGYVITDNTEMLLKNHLSVTKGQVRTRFPPEPNGILHIGHAKAIHINFGYAAAHNGICFLRYDDTNPEKEEEKFFTGIYEMVEWIGYKPYKITHSSDYFDQLYDLAVKLIQKGLAYVCHQKQEEIKGFNPPPSPWRDRSIEENLIGFQKMKYGLVDEGGATLRMKVTLEEGKQDPVAYRIKFLPHPRAGYKWCIYPTYDYTHCLCDSIEHITHSLCTKEFQSRRSTYYWLCNALDLYCPVQWEYGRLNMNYTVVSKRKIAKLITSGIVKDWDDPRLFTLTALKRRGFPSEAINTFCAKMGVTGAQTVVDPQMLESEVRTVLNETAPRTMVVMEPLKIKICNYSLLNAPSHINVADYPNNPEKGSHMVSFHEIIYIEKSDFKIETDKLYRRLSMKQSVGLRYTGYVIRTESVKYDDSNEIIELNVIAEQVDQSNKPKAFIHWVADPIPVRLMLYDKLFLHKNPEEVENGFMSDINPESLNIMRGFADKYLNNYAKNCNTFQFERIGFFAIDAESSNSLLVFNRTVTLKEDSSKM